MAKAEVENCNCPDCKKDTVHIIITGYFAYITRTCISCGRQWFDGEWQPLDFSPIARRDNRRWAQKMYEKINAAREELAK